jgi:protein-serine/threonine kinase
LGHKVEGKVVASGGSGDKHEIFQVKDRQTGNHYAMKMISLGQWPRFSEYVYANEVRLQDLVHSDHVVSIHKRLRTQNGNLAIMTEFMEDGELAEKIRKSGGLEDGLNLVNTFYQIVDGVKVCHDRDVVHLNLKPENIWVHGKEVKIGDFGHAMEIQKPGENRVPKGGGTIGYLAPELVRAWATRVPKGIMLQASTEDEALIAGSRVDLKAIDIWALGVTFYKLLTNRFPFKNKGGLQDFLQQLEKKGLKGVYIPLPASVDRDAADLVLRMLQPDPTKRWTIEQVASHEYFKKHKLGDDAKQRRHALEEEADMYTRTRRKHVPSKVVEWKWAASAKDV